ncbi:Uncharacterised protein [Providencia rettgeri]|uniref:Uncharacterized protein n=1 Tax=Providencia rettgeri TaxID=587 RepID=A0A9N8D9X1_PRORE|nr:Uncharacterised protein [Providencia rettgeri]CAB5719861.1 Uncharacterised protein [Providencia rettgeri]CAC9265265.1 Uncharacterised protein [Providencia rettgeri]CAC9293946.1 Uncharacterised protein [Providencia rettgeri]
MDCSLTVLAMMFSASPGISEAVTLKPEASKVVLAQSSCLGASWLSFPDISRVIGKPRNSGLPATISTPRRVTVLPSKAIITRCGSLKPSVTVRIGLCRDRTTCSTLRPKSRCVALLQRLAAVRGRLSLCADQAAAAKWWLSMPMASVSAEGPMPKALSTRRTSPLMPGCRHQGRACPLRRARMTSNPLIVA